MQSWCSALGNIWSYNDFLNFLMKIFPKLDGNLWKHSVKTEPATCVPPRPAWFSQDKVLFVVFLLPANNLDWAGPTEIQLEDDGNLFLMANSDNLTVINGCLNLRVVSTALTKESCTVEWLGSDVNKGRNYRFYIKADMSVLSWILTILSWMVCWHLTYPVKYISDL